MGLWDSVEEEGDLFIGFWKYFKSLFKSKAEKEFLGEKVSCSRCGRVFYKAKQRLPPPELIGKTSFESVMKCTYCGRVYCGSSFGGFSCGMYGCSCGNTNFEMVQYVHKY